LQGFRPLIRFVALQAKQKFSPLRTAQYCLDLRCQSLRLLHTPLRRQASVHQDILAFHMQQAAMRQPVQQLLAIRRLEHTGQGIVFTTTPKTGIDHQQI